MYLDGLKIRL